MKRIALCLLVWSLWLSIATYADKKEIRIALFIPHESPYWNYTSSFAEAVSRDLKIQLDVYTINNNREIFIQTIKQVITSVNKPDGVLMPNYSHSAYEILDLLEKKRVPSILFDESLHGKSHSKFGKPRTKLKYWLGEFIPDNVEAGADLANALIDEAFRQERVDLNKKVQILAFSGTSYSGASIARIEGLKQAIRARKNAILNEITSGFWREPVSKLKFRRLIQQYPDTTVIWAANDLMPLGIASLLKHELNLVPAKDIIIGGINGISDMQAVAEGNFNVSVGGHFMLGGWSLILLHDYLKGIDFATESTQMRIRLFTLNQKNIKPYFEKFGKGKWDAINFKLFSKYYNPKLLKYNFGLKAILQQIDSQ